MSDEKSYDEEVPLSPEEEEERGLPEEEGFDRNAERDYNEPSEKAAPKQKGALRPGAGETGKKLPNVKDAAKGAAKDAASKVGAAIPGSEHLDAAQEKVKQARKLGTDIARTAQAVGSGFSKVIAAVASPAFWISALVIIVATLLLISVMSIGQVFGKQTSTGGSGAAADVLGRLAQRAEWLQEHYSEYPKTQDLTSLGLAPASNLSSNPWPSACPNIVAIIYGLSPYLVNYNGNVNAYDNYSAHPEMYQSHAFGYSRGDGSVTPGASLSQPPPGAIVSIDYPGGAYGHTFVMLTDTLVIDNWGSGGIANGGPGPRVLSDTMRSQIVGWALPVNEGFEGTFITGSFTGEAENAAPNPAMPGLPPLPAWAGTAS